MQRVAPAVEGRVVDFDRGPAYYYCSCSAEWVQCLARRRSLGRRALGTVAGQHDVEAVERAGCLFGFDEHGRTSTLGRGAGSQVRSGSRSASRRRGVLCLVSCVSLVSCLSSLVALAWKPQIIGLCNAATRELYTPT